MRAINPKYRQLRAFTLAVETQSFRIAAERLCVTQPSFSVLIKELESDLGVELFEREGRGMKVTLAGADFYSQIHEPLGELEAAYAKAKAGVGRGEPTLRVATLPSLSTGIVGDKVADFQRRNPRVRITLLEQKHNQIAPAVLKREVDIGIGSFLEPHPSLRFTPLFQDQLAIVALPEHPVLRLPPTWKSLTGFDLVLLTGGPTERGMKMSRATPANVLEIEQAPTALAMVRNGMGLTILPSTILPSCNLVGLVSMPMEGEFASRNIGLIQRDGEKISSSVRAFIEMLGDLQAIVGAVR
jgi:LysR family carnitine catabolism transcriptional activator